MPNTTDEVAPALATDAERARTQPSPAVAPPRARSLAEVVRSIEDAFTAGDVELTAQLLAENPVAAWFGMNPERFTGIVRALERSGAPDNALLRVMRTMLAGDGGGVDIDRLRTDLASADFDPEIGALSSQMLALRMRGHPVEAMQPARGLLSMAGAIPPLVDSHSGVGIVIALQVGITAMLAGDFVTALTSFTRARMHPLIPHLAFLQRDAAAKSAVIEALFGAPDIARRLLEEAETLPRADSWVDAVIDVGVTIAESLVRAEIPEQGLQMLQSASLQSVGEMWPFYVAALRQLMAQAGRDDDARLQTEVFRSLPLAGVKGEGFAGSVLPIAEACDALACGDLTRARDQVAEADASIVVTRLAAARIDLTASRPGEALRHLEGLHTETRGLRMLEVARLALFAGCHLALGAPEDSAEILERMMQIPGGLGRWESRSIPADVHAFAKEHVPGWPFADEGLSNAPFQSPLTAREIDILRVLGRGLTREQIAEELFITLNTLKVHLRSLYRKLGVHSRAAAVLEAERRGIL